MNTLTYGGDYSYADTRLRGTLVKNPLGEGLAYVKGILSDGHARLLMFTRGIGKQTKEIPLKSIDLTPPKLGFINLHGNALHISRRPVRHYRAGLSENSLNIVRITGGMGVSASEQLLVGAGYSPPAQCAEKVLCGDVRSEAFTNDFAFADCDESLRLYYKGLLVGKASLNVDAEQVNFSIDSEYSFLNELFEESLNATECKS